MAPNRRAGRIRTWCRGGRASIQTRWNSHQPYLLANRFRRGRASRSGLKWRRWTSSYQVEEITRLDQFKDTVCSSSRTVTWTKNRWRSSQSACHKLSLIRNRYGTMRPWFLQILQSPPILRIVKAFLWISKGILRRYQKSRSMIFESPKLLKKI